MEGRSVKPTLLPFELNYLTEEIKAKAREELGETEEVKVKALAELRQLIRDEGNLVIPMDDHYLLQYLRVRKYKPKVAFSVLRNYYRTKKSYVEVYGTPDIDGLIKCITDGFINVLPYRDKEGSIVIIIRTNKWNLDEIKFTAFLHAITVVAVGVVDMFVATQVCGIKFIIDAKGISLRHVFHISIKHLHLVAKGLTNCLPVRFRAIHVYNEPPIFHYLWNIITVLLTSKIRNRVRFHSSDLKSLHNFFEPEMLPEEYGGKLKYDNGFFLRKIDQLRDRYAELHTYGYM